MGSDESHFNVSVGSDGQSHKTVSTNHNLFEDGEPKRYRTEVLPLGQTGSQLSVDRWNAQYMAVCGRSKLPRGRVILSRSEKYNRQASRSDSSDNIATQEVETILKYIGQRTMVVAA